MPLDKEVGLGSGDFVLDGDPASPKKGGGGTASQFLAFVKRFALCYWTSAKATLCWMETQLPCPSPHKKGGTAPPIFSPCPLWPNGWMD